MSPKAESESASGVCFRLYWEFLKEFPFSGSFDLAVLPGESTNNRFVLCLRHSGVVGVCLVVGLRRREGRYGIVMFEPVTRGEGELFHIDIHFPSPGEGMVLFLSSGLMIKL